MTAPSKPENPFSQLFSQFLRTWNYRPVTSWDDFFNPQFFINSNVEDAPVENDVLHEVGSYGKQLGTIIAALNVVIAKATLDHLSPSEQQAIDRFRSLTRGVDAVVARHRPSWDQALSPADVSEFLDRLRALDRDDPAAARVIGRQVAETVSTLSGP